LVAQADSQHFGRTGLAGAFVQCALVVTPLGSGLVARARQALAALGRGARGRGCGPYTNERIAPSGRQTHPIGPFLSPRLTSVWRRGQRLPAWDSERRGAHGLARPRRPFYGFTALSQPAFGGDRPTAPVARYPRGESELLTSGAVIDAFRRASAGDTRNQEATK